MGNNTKSNFIGDSTLQTLVDQYNTFISQLTFEQLNALALLCGAIFMLTLLTSIFMTLFGEFMLNKFQIESKFPRLERLIKIRRSFQRYFLILNISLIALTLLVIIYINVAILIS